MEFLSNPVAFFFVTVAVGLVVYLAIIFALFEVWTGPRLSWRTVVVLATGVVVAAAAAVLVHDAHIHQDPHLTEMVEGCLEDPECSEALRGGQ